MPLVLTGTAETPKLVAVPLAWAIVTGQVGALNVPLDPRLPGSVTVKIVPAVRLPVPVVKVNVPVIESHTKFVTQTGAVALVPTWPVAPRLYVAVPSPARPVMGPASVICVPVATPKLGVVNCGLVCRATSPVPVVPNHVGAAETEPVPVWDRMTAAFEVLPASRVCAPLAPP